MRFSLFDRCLTEKAKTAVRVHEDNLRFLSNPVLTLPGRRALGERRGFAHGSSFDLILMRRCVPNDGWEWFQDDVEHEISPLLEEYWFDSQKDFNRALDALNQPFA